MLVRFIAAALIGWSIVDFALYWALSEHNHTPMKFFSWVLDSLPALVGVVVLVRAKAVAQWISDKLEL